MSKSPVLSRARKSTLLRLIAGLEDMSSGEISIGGKRVNDLPPRDRDIAMVFQSYALYPHMSVRDNMSYSLKLKRTRREIIADAVHKAAAMLGLEALQDRKPRALSGGQRQRVAMGRAIVRKPPDARRCLAGKPGDCRHPA